MDISKAIAELKKEPGFADNVGMILIHNGVVRGWSRKDKTPVSAVEVHPDHARISELVQEYQSRPGIWRIIAKANEGRLSTGDDLLFIIVAGDIRENVKPVLSEILDRIKSEAVVKTEVFA
ncbi:MAG: molybdenum cofactor biosynthesis protein MoaE [Desulfovibrionaceae bacterium]